MKKKQLVIYPKTFLYRIYGFVALIVAMGLIFPLSISYALEGNPYKLEKYITSIVFEIAKEVFT